MAEVFPVNTDRVQMAAHRLRLDLNALADSITSQYTSLYDRVWKDEDPAALVAAMGTDAVKLFTLSGSLAQVLAAAGITDIPLTMPEGWTFAANPDGSVVIAKV